MRQDNFSILISILQNNKNFFIYGIWSILGNQYIYELTVYGYTVLRVELTSFDGEVRQIEYDFNIEDKTNNYRLHISELSASGIGKNLLHFHQWNICFYYTSEEFFLYKTTVDKWTIHHFSRQKELWTVHSFFYYCTPTTF